MLYRCDKNIDKLDKDERFTFYNEVTKSHSYIDYFVSSSNVDTLHYEILTPLLNLSDHRPVVWKCNCQIHECAKRKDDRLSASSWQIPVFRWDKANLSDYKNAMGDELRDIYDLCCDLELRGKNDLEKIQNNLNGIHDKLTQLLSNCSNLVVPKVKKNFWKFWWDEELNELKQKSISSHREWLHAKRPNSGEIYAHYRKCKSEYKSAIHRHQAQESQVYTNDLHDALMQKQNTTFWKCWKAKFGRNTQKIMQVDGTVDTAQIASNFAKFFAEISSDAHTANSDKLEADYFRLRRDYSGHPVGDRFDAELVERVINAMQRGKAAGLDGITAEHLQFAHSLLPTVLSKLFNLILMAGRVPENFCTSYTVPLLKGSISAMSKTLCANDFRGISISPTISKVFEHCIFKRYESYLTSDNNQFGFKKGSGCTKALFTLKSVVDYYVSLNSTVNICSLDISKAYDKMNHNGLFIKLMKRCIPLELLMVFEYWFKNGHTCVRWGNVYSHFFMLHCGVRQGGVLSPHFFAVYINDIITDVKKSKVGCKLMSANMSILVYADDILLLAPSVSSLQLLLNICYNGLECLCLKLNVLKSICIRIGNEHKNIPSHLVTSKNNSICWSNKIRYLGVYIVSKNVFYCSLENAKRSFYMAFNAIYGKIGNIASEELLIHLMKTKCLPKMLYGLESVPLNKSQISSLNFVVNSSLMKIFKTKSIEIIRECKDIFQIDEIENYISKRKTKFLDKTKALSLQNRNTIDAVLVRVSV